MGSCRTPFWSMNPARSFSSRSARPQGSGGKCSPHFRVQEHPTILLPLRNRLNRLAPETLCHQQPVLCEIAGEKGRKRSIFRRPSVRANLSASPAKSSKHLFPPLDDLAGRSPAYYEE